MARCAKRVKMVQFGLFFVALTYAYHALLKKDVAGIQGNDTASVIPLWSSTVLLTTTEVQAKNVVNREKQETGVNNSKKKTDGELVCGRPWKTDWNAIEKANKPLINLRTDRFIYPWLVNGPNNQLIGLRDTIYLAVKLNRTVILPHFFKHKTDTTVSNRSRSPVPVSQRVDVASIASLVSVFPYSLLEETCTDGFDDLYFTSYKAMHSSLAHVENDVGIPVSSKHTGELAEEYPVDADPSFNALFHVHSGKIALRKLYDSPGMCALYVAPYRTVGVKESPGSLKRVFEKFFHKNATLLGNKINPDSLSDDELYALIVHSTPKPRHITAIVNDVMVAFGLEYVSFISVHWRYDPVDWQKRCRKDKKHLAKRKDFLIEMCRKIENITPSDVARAILKFVREVERKTSINISAMYFAAPLNMENFVQELQTELNLALEKEGAIEELQIYTQSDLHNYLLKYSSCESFKENYEDIFSLLEMDVCARAKAFLRSPSSSWSKVIKERRVINAVEKYDGNIFDLSWKVAEARLLA